MTKTLADYEKQAKTMDIGTLIYALKDVSETLNLRRDLDMQDPYIIKLYNEFDAYSVELHNRRHGKK
jgi:hypothetical protein